MIGSVLIQSQRIRRIASQAGNDTLIDDLTSLVSKLLLDPEQTDRVLQVLEEALSAMVERLFSRQDINLENALERLRQLLKPMLDSLEAFAGSPPDIEDPEDMANLLVELADSLARTAENLDITSLREFITALLDILETDLGLSIQFLEAQIWMLIDDVIDKLRQPLPDLPENARATHLAMASLLSRFKRLIFGKFQLPQLNADHIADFLLQSLRNIGLDVFAEKASCIAAAMRDAFTSGRTLIDAAAATNFGPGSIGPVTPPAFGDEYRWYASWLLKDRTRPWGFSLLDWLPGFPGDEVWRTEDGRQIVQRNVFRDDRLLHEGENIKWHEAPLFSDSTLDEYYTFSEKLNPDFLENWARHTSTWITDLLKTTLHIISAFEKGDRASNISHASWTAANAVFEQIVRRPFISWLNSGFKGPQGTRWPLGWFVPILITLLASREGRHTKAEKDSFNFWLILVIDDTLEALTFDIAGNLLRDLSLSIFTLLNYKEPADSSSKPPFNGNHLDGLVSLFLLGTNWILMKLFETDRNLYAHLFAGDLGRLAKMWLFWGLLIGSIMTSLGVFLGTLAAFLLMGKVDFSIIKRPLLSQNIKSFTTFWISLYLSHEGNTGDGKYNPRGSKFAGYPDHDSSLYKLPYESGKSVMCVQGNQGMWSHFDLGGSSQVYAYDFALDQGDEILASRAGTVVDYFDWVPDDQNVNTNAPAGATIPGQTNSDNWNFIAIRHDEPGDPVAGQDRDQGGTPVTTYAIYGHGRNGSVRQVFNSRGIASNNIIGQSVLQGQPIMLAGNTGISFHNHLHLEVRTGPTPATDAPPVARSNFSVYTIPFVFQEVTNFIGPDGVPKSLKFYTSNNTKVP